MACLITSAATSHGEAERAELLRIVARLEFHVAEERAVAAQAAVEAELVGQGHVQVGTWRADFLATDETRMKHGAKNFSRSPPSVFAPCSIRG